MLHLKLAHETTFLRSFLIGSTNTRIFLLTNQQVVINLSYPLGVDCSVHTVDFFSYMS